MSIAWGARSVDLFVGQEYRGRQRFWWQFYQFIFNFVGSFAGWCCTYILATRVKAVLGSPHGVFGPGDFVLFLLSFLGATGHLPQSMAGILDSIGKIGGFLSQKCN
jgi:hypothetical protein